MLCATAAEKRIKQNKWLSGPGGAVKDMVARLNAKETREAKAKWTRPGSYASNTPQQLHIFLTSVQV
jgi:hypothetical protein